ncbi:MAG: hypothetical protein K2F99_06420 [Muribaculaceae bacterium]|nr:hypothetical protein [Muribaculaceae bacterium]
MKKTTNASARVIDDITNMFKREHPIMECYHEDLRQEVWCQTLERLAESGLGYPELKKLPASVIYREIRTGLLGWATSTQALVYDDKAAHNTIIVNMEPGTVLIMNI